MSRRRGRPRVVAVINFKGGVGKTTSLAYLLHVWARLGLRTAGVDADKQGSLLRWAGLAGWSVPVLGLATPTLHRQIFGVLDPARYDVIGIDTPPLEEQMGVVMSVLRVADEVVVPMAPSMIELDRIAPVWAALEDVAALRETELRVRVLFTRTVALAGSTDTIRELLTEDGRPVMATTIPRRERYAQAFGAPVTASDGPYVAAAAELMGGWA